ALPISPDDAEREEECGHGYAQPPARRERRRVRQPPGGGPEALERPSEDAHQPHERGKREQPAREERRRGGDVAANAASHAIGTRDQVERERECSEHRSEAAVGPGSLGATRMLLAEELERAHAESLAKRTDRGYGSRRGAERDAGQPVASIQIDHAHRAPGIEIADRAADEAKRAFRERASEEHAERAAEEPDHDPFGAQEEHHQSARRAECAEERDLASPLEHR